MLNLEKHNGAIAVSTNRLNAIEQHLGGMRNI